MSGGVSTFGRHLLEYLSLLKDQGVSALEISRERAEALRGPRRSARSRPALPTGSAAATYAPQASAAPERTAGAGISAAASGASLPRESGSRPVSGGGTVPEIVFIAGSPPAGAVLDETQVISEEAGRIMDRLLVALGMTREQVVLTSVFKRRPEPDRTFSGEAAEKSRLLLDEQIGSLRPRVLVALGTEALSLLMGNKIEISSARGRWMKYRGFDMMPVYHPEYLVKAPKRAWWQVWEDMLLVLERIGREAPERVESGR